MTDNPYNPESPVSRSGPSSGPGPKHGVFASTWGASRTGVRVGAMIGGALALIPFLAALGLAALMRDRGRGRAQFVWLASVFSSSRCLAACWAGLGLIGALIRASARSRTIASRLQTGAKPVEVVGTGGEARGADGRAPNRRRAFWPWFACGNCDRRADRFAGRL